MCALVGVAVAAYLGGVDPVLHTSSQPDGTRAHGHAVKVMQALSGGDAASRRGGRRKIRDPSDGSRDGRKSAPLNRGLNRIQASAAGLSQRICLSVKTNQPHYIPPLKYGWLTALYDPLLRSTVQEQTFKLRLIEQAGIQQSQNILDLGCGTATLTLLIKRLHPETQVVGLDADLKALGIARAKATQAKLEVGLDIGMSTRLPYPDRYFHRVLSSLFFHHLTLEDKRRTLGEMFRVLRPQGELHVADWGKAQNVLMRAAFLLVQVLDGFETTSGNVKGELPEAFQNAGFEQVRETCSYMTVFGTLSLYQATKPRL